MILTCRVTSVHDGSEFTDERRRVELMVKEADSYYKRIRVPSETLQLGDEFELVPVIGTRERIAADLLSTHDLGGEA